MTPFDEQQDGHHLDALTAHWAFEIGQTKRDELLRLASLVATWGQRTDLVSAKTPAALIEVLMLDAFFLAQAIWLNRRVLDVGAGAGAPGIALAVLRPDLHLTLLEPRRRRIAFMRTAIGTLGLSERVHAQEGRLEDDEALDFHVAYSRATFEPAEWLARGRRCAPSVIVLLAGQDPPETEGLSLERSWSYETLDGAPRRLARYGAS